MNFYMSLVDDRNHSPTYAAVFFCNEVSDAGVVEKRVFLRKMLLHFTYQWRNIERVVLIKNEGESDKIIEVSLRCNLNDFCHAMRPVFFRTFSTARSTITRCS